MYRELRLNAFGMGFRDVEDDARGTCAGIQRDLQVLDVVIESRRVEGHAVLRIFDAGFVVPKRLVLILLETTERGDVGAAAKRYVKRIVDAAQAEALGCLDIDAEAAIGLPADDPAGRETMRRRFDVQLSVTVGEETAGNEVADF